MINKLIEWSIANRFIVAVLASILILIGLFVSANSDVDVLPDFAPPQVAVRTEAPGLASEDVEAYVSLPIESALNGLPGVRLVRSTSMTGLSNVMVIFDYGEDIYRCRQLVTEKLPVVTAALGKGVGPPVMLPVMPVVADVLKIALIPSTTSLMDVRTIADWDIKNRLLAVPGVSRVTVWGGEQLEYQVLIHPDKLKTYGLSVDQVRLAAEKGNMSAPGGFIVTSEQQLPIRTICRIRNVSELENSMIAIKQDTPILLKNVATVQKGAAFKIGDATVEGRPAVLIVVNKQPGVNTVDLTRKLETAFDSLRPGLPKDIKVLYTFRLADFIEKAISNVLFSVVLGGAIVVIVLFFFLQNWRASVISLSAIPLSLLATILALKFTGRTINTMTLGGLAIAIGEVVDDAIIDVENVYRRLRENQASGSPKPSWRVVYDACCEVRSSVVYATLIVALVFLPVFVLQGLEGRIFGPLAFAYIVAVLSSLLVAITVTPAACTYLLGGRKQLPQHESFFVAQAKRIYGEWLKLILGRPAIVVITSIGLFLGSVLLLPLMGQEFLPKFQEGNLVITINALPGQNLDLSKTMGMTIQRELMKNPDVITVGQRLGRAEQDEDAGQPTFSELDVRLKESKHNLDDLIGFVQSKLNSLPGIVYDISSFITSRIDEVVSGGSRTDINVKIFGPDLDTLRQLSETVSEILKDVPGAVSVHTETQSYQPEITVNLNRERAARYGITGADLATTVETAFYGKVVSQVLNDQRSFPLKVIFDNDSRKNIDVLRSTPIDTPSGFTVPLGDVANIESTQGPSAIIRENVSRRTAVLASTFKRDVVSIVKDLRGRIAKQLTLPPGYYIVYSGQFEAQQEASGKLFSTAVLALLGILVLLRQGLGSWKATLLVAANLPLASIGGILAVAMTGNVLSIGSLVGFISLFGISTRNSLMLVSRIHALINEGKPSDQAILDGALERLTPVLMTATTAAVGMLPLAVMGGTGRELEQPLAIVIVGGMVTSTALTLLVIPALFKLSFAFTDTEEQQFFHRGE